jgi:alkylhydroperoxidase family enzyme
MPRITIDDQIEDLPGFAFGLAPEIATAANAFSVAAYQHCRLSLRELEGARFMTARINGCQVCQRFRAKRDLEASVRRNGGDGDILALRAGEAPDEAFYESVPNWRNATNLSTRERLVIELAERMGAQPHSMEGDEPFWKQLHAAFTDAEIVNATLTISSWIALGRVIHTLELDTICLPTFEQEAA